METAKQRQKQNTKTLLIYVLDPVYLLPLLKHPFPDKLQRPASQPSIQVSLAYGRLCPGEAGGRGHSQTGQHLVTATHWAMLWL